MLPAPTHGFQAPAQEPINYDPKCLCVICIDTSSSMQGEPIMRVNAALQVFSDELMQEMTTKSRVEICLVTFDSEVNCLQEPTDLKTALAALRTPLATKGTTKLVDGMRLAMAKIEERKAYYRRTGQGNYYRSVLMLITDGAPDQGQDVAGLSSQLQDADQTKKFTFFPVAVGRQVPSSFTDLCHPTMVMQLDGLKFVELFKWLSNTLSTISHSNSGENVAFPSPNSWSGGVFMQKSV